jgi:hypothetical protein
VIIFTGGGNEQVGVLHRVRDALKHAFRLKNEGRQRDSREVTARPKLRNYRQQNILLVILHHCFQLS